MPDFLLDHLGNNNCAPKFNLLRCIVQISQYSLDFFNHGFEVVSTFSIMAGCVKDTIWFSLYYCTWGEMNHFSSSISGITMKCIRYGICGKITECIHLALNHDLLGHLLSSAQIVFVPSRLHPAPCFYSKLRWLTPSPLILHFPRVFLDPTWLRWKWFDLYFLEMEYFAVHKSCVKLEPH